MLGQLVPCGGGPPIPLLKPKLLVGRQNICDIPLGYATVSARHCELEFQNGFWFVRDLGSSNGTRVNGTACTSQRLLPNDVLSVARYRYTVEYTPPAGVQPPPVAQPPASMAGSRKQPAEGPPDRADKPEPAQVAESSAGPALGELVPCGGGNPIPLRKPLLIIGRNPACDIVLRFATVSSRHCQLEWANGFWLVRDLGSRNGVRVDGVRCESKSVPPGSVLGIANQRFQIEYAPAGAGPKTKQPLFSQSLLEKAGLSRWQPEPAGAASDEDEPPRKKLTLEDTD